MTTALVLLGVLAISSAAALIWGAFLVDVDAHAERLLGPMKGDR